MNPNRLPEPGRHEQDLEPYTTETTSKPIRKEKPTMKKDYTHILIVLDASGSMSSIQDDIKGSFNE